MLRVPAVMALIMVVLVVSPSSVGARGGTHDALTFDRFPVYFAGKHVLGLKLKRVDVFENGRRSDVAATYGSCDQHHGGGCRYELQIISTSICVTYPDVYFSPPRLHPINRAQGGWIRTSKHFDVYTGRTAVSIFRLRRGDAKHVAERLKNIRPGARREHLPDVKDQFLEGEARCQHGVDSPAPPESRMCTVA
jgi:hypothetical protein